MKNDGTKNNMTDPCSLTCARNVTYQLIISFRLYYA